MTDEERTKYIPLFGDRVAVLSFCRQKEASFQKEGFMNKFQQTCEDRRRKRKARLPETQQTSVGNHAVMERYNNTNGVKNKRRVEVGWLHFQDSDFHQLRPRNGGGTRHLTLDKNTTVSDIMNITKDLFFSWRVVTKRTHYRLHILHVQLQKTNSTSGLYTGGTV